MPNYRVGASLTMRAGGYSSTLTGASSQTRRFGSVISRTAGAATRSFSRLTGSVGSIGGALRRVAGGARAVGTATRRMADTMASAITRTRRRVDGLITRFRALRRAGQTAGGGVSGGIGRLAAVAGGAYGVARVVTGEADLSKIYTDLAVKAGLDKTQQADIQRRLEAAAESARIPRRKLLESVYKEYELSGNLAPALSDLAPTARTLAIDPNTAGADLGAVRAQFANYGLDTAADRERAMLQMVLASAAGSLSVADLARAAGEAMAAQTEIFGNRDWESFLIGSQRAMTGFMKAEPTMTAVSAFTKVMSLEREALEALIGEVDPKTTGITEIAERLVAAVGGNAANLKGTPFGTQETLGVLAGLTGEKGQAVGANVVAAITGSIDKMRGRTEQVWQRQTDEPAAQIALAKDIGQRDTGNLLLQVARPAALAVVKHLPKIELAATGLLAIWAGGKVFGMARTGVNFVRGQRGAPGAVGGGLASVGASSVATMRVGTLIVSTMAGGGAAGGGAILGPDGRPARGGTVAGSAGGRPQSPRGRFAGAAGGLATVGRRIPYAAGAIAALTAGPALLKGDVGGAVQATAGVAGGWGGALGGAKLGAAIGTALAPGVGTAIGAALGGIGGSILGWMAAERVTGSLLSATAGGADVAEAETPRRTGHARRRRRTPPQAAQDEAEAETPRRTGHARRRRRTPPQAAQDEVPIAPHAASRTVIDNRQDHSRIEVTVQGADDPRETAAAVADEVERRSANRRRQRDRQARDLSLDDPRPDVF